MDPLTIGLTLGLGSFVISMIPLCISAYKHKFMTVVYSSSTND